MATNKHPGNCETCRTRVLAGQGELRKIGARWIVLCAAHGTVTTPAVTAAQAVMALVVRVWLAAGRVFCAPVGHLKDNAFSAYREVTRAAGFFYSKEDNAQVGTVAQALALVEGLRAVNLTPDVSPELLVQLQAREAQAHGEVTAAQLRATEVNARLAERGLALMGFQGIGIEWLAPRRKALLGDDMGLGKTVQALTAAPTNAPVVVVCPSVAKGVWVREVSRFRPDLTPVALSGRDSFRWAQPGEMVIINYDILPGEPAEKKGYAATLPADLANAPAGTVLIGDEAHMLKESDANRTSQFRALREAVLAADGRVWLLTATPILNRPTELWALLQAMSAGREVYGSYENFCRLWNTEQGRYGTIWGNAEPEVATLLKKIMLRRMKRDVLTQLPPKTIRDVEVNGLSDAVKRLCDQALAQLEADGVSVEEALRIASETENITRPSIQIWSKARAALATVKLGAALDMIEAFEDAEEPVVVFSAHRAAIDTLGKRPGWAAITGDTPGTEREAIAARFQAGELIGVAATIAAGGVAITLTRASNAIFIDEAVTPALNNQAQDRIYRIGQSRGVVITRLVAAHALDRHTAMLLARKNEIIASSVDAAVVGADEVVSSIPTVDVAAINASGEAAIAAEVALLEAEQVAAATVVPTAPALSPTDARIVAINHELRELNVGRTMLADNRTACRVLDARIAELMAEYTKLAYDDIEIAVAESCPF